MTCLAWCGKTLAADSRSSCDGDIVCDNTQKIYTLNDIPYVIDTLKVIAVAGRLADFDKIMHYLHSEDFPSANINHGVHAIIVGERFVYMLENNSGYLIRYPKKTQLATGSGGVFAKSGMMLGLSAKDAVKHAIKISTSCGGRIQSWSE